MRDIITHHEAKRLLTTLEADPETITALRSYIDRQTNGPADWDTVSDREHSIRAANRATEAISRLGALMDDLRAIRSRIASLEAAQTDLSTVLEAVLSIIENGQFRAP